MFVATVQNQVFRASENKSPVLQWPPSVRPFFRPCTCTTWEPRASASDSSRGLEKASRARGDWAGSANGASKENKEEEKIIIVELTAFMSGWVYLNYYRYFILYIACYALVI